MSQDPNDRTYELEGKTLGFPSIFGDACSAIGMFVVSSAAAKTLMADSGFDVVEVAPGRAMFTLSCVNYRESDCGVYQEISMAFFVRKKGRRNLLPYLGNWIDILRDQAATYNWRLPVTSKLANDAGIYMWGLPKTIEKISFEIKDERAVFTLEIDGQEILSYSVAAQGNRHMTPSASAVYSNFEGTQCVTQLTHENWDMGTRLGDGQLILGNHPLSEQLRTLGLPKKPLISSWIGKMALSVTAPEKL